MEGEQKQYVGLREYSRIIGCDIVIISRAIKDGKIPGDAIKTNERNGRPQIDLQKAEEAWGIHYRETRNKSKKQHESIDNTVVFPVKQAKKAAMNTPESAQRPDQGDVQADLPDNALPYKEADRREKIADMRIKELKAAELAGKLVQVEAIERVFFDFSRVMRNGFQNIADRVIDQILSTGSRNEAHILLQAEIDKVLQNVSTLPEYRGQ